MARAGRSGVPRKAVRREIGAAAGRGLGLIPYDGQGVDAICPVRERNADRDRVLRVLGRHLNRPKKLVIWGVEQACVIGKAVLRWNIYQQQESLRVAGLRGHDGSSAAVPVDQGDGR